MRPRSVRCSSPQALPALFGRTVVVAALASSSALAAVALASSSEAISQLPGRAGCISQTGSRGECTKGRGVVEPTGVEISPDGRNVYVAGSGSNSVAIFDRNPADGHLRQLPRTAGCIARGGFGCAHAKAIGQAGGVAVSPDDRAVYVVGGDSITIFRRDPRSGALTRLSGKAGCIADNGGGGRCEDGTALNDGFDLAVSPDGQSVYGVSIGSNAVTAFGR